MHFVQNITNRKRSILGMTSQAKLGSTIGHRRYLIKDLRALEPEPIPFGATRLIPVLGRP